MTQLQILADLTFQINDDVCQIHSSENVIQFEVHNVRALRSLWKSLKAVPAQTTRLRQFHEALNQSGLKLEIRLEERLLARMGKDARAGFISRLLGFGPLEIHFLSAVKFWLR